MSKRQPTLSFRRQMRQSMEDLRSIMARGQSPSGNGRFTVRTVEVIQPSKYDPKALQKIRRSLNLSQALFAQVLGVSGSLIRSWELGTRTPSAIARRLLDQVRANPASFASLVRTQKSGNAAVTVKQASKVA